MQSDYVHETLIWDFTNDREIHTISAEAVYYEGLVTDKKTRQHDPTWYDKYYIVYEFYIEKSLQARYESRQKIGSKSKEKQQAEKDIGILEKARTILGDSAVFPFIDDKVCRLKRVMAWQPSFDPEWKIPNDIDIVTRDRER